MNSQQEAFRRFAQQLQRASQGGGGLPGGSPRGLFAGGGLLIALVAGGLALNASLFNGEHTPSCILDDRLNDKNAVDGGHRAIKYTRYAGWGPLAFAVSDGCLQATWSDRACVQ